MKVFAKSENTEWGCSAAFAAPAAPPGEARGFAEAQVSPAAPAALLRDVPGRSAAPVSPAAPVALLREASGGSAAPASSAAPTARPSEAHGEKVLYLFESRYVVDKQSFMQRWVAIDTNVYIKI